MNSWYDRHLRLTREEILLLAGILVILLCGMTAKYIVADRPLPDSPQASTPP